MTYVLDLNRARGVQDLMRLINLLNDGLRTNPQSLVIVKISDAFSMYHQVSRRSFKLRRSEFKGLHPVLINDLDTDRNVIITMTANGQLLHYYLINDWGRLLNRDSLSSVARQNANQEYLDYFYCIVKNIENYLGATADFNDK